MTSLCDGVRRFVCGASLLCVSAIAFAPRGACAQTRAGALAGPPDAFAAARAALSDTARGAPLTITLLTEGQGPAVWERYGHNMLWIRNTATGESVVWEWGLFNFDEPGFIQRFLFGSAQYAIGGDEANPKLNYIVRTGRPLVAQDLALTAGQRAAVDAFVHANALQENRFYRYDYFLDNCSTRLRDVLDFVLGGAIRMALEPHAGNDTFRSETLRLNQHNAWLFAGLDLALGWPSDRAMTSWEMSFVPMRLRDALRSVMVAGADGAPTPLVRNERVLVRGSNAEPTETNTMGVRTALVLGALGVALFAVLLGVRASRGSRAARLALSVVAAVTHLVLGAAGSLLVFMWLFTRHAFWAWNPHLLLFTPLSLVLAAVLTLRWRGTPRWVVRYHLIMAASGFAVTIVVLASHLRGPTVAADMLVAWATAAWLLHLALGVALGRAAEGTGTGPQSASAAGQRIAA